MTHCGTRFAWLARSADNTGERGGPEGVVVYPGRFMASRPNEGRLGPNRTTANR